jgi:integrase
MRHDGIRTKSAERDLRPKDDELKRLYSHWDAKKRQQIPMTEICHFAIATGMRKSEITRIRWDDLDTDNKTVVIRKRKHPTDPKDETVPLLDVTGYDAWALIQSQPQQGPRIFTVNPKSVSSSFTRACKALKIEDLHFHDLRHEATSRLFEAGYQIQEVALVTGHNDWKILQRYTQLRPEDLHR